MSLKEYETDLIEIRKRFELLTKEISVKANIKDVCVLADSKPSNLSHYTDMDDVNNALREINEALGTKVTDS